MTARTPEHPSYMIATRLDRVAFRRPLPGTADLSPEAKFLVRESDSDLRHDRLESALDAALGLNAIEPWYIPGFLRTAELLVATRRWEQARTLLRSISRQQSVYERNEFNLDLTKLQMHIEPGVDVARDLAERILEHQMMDLTVPYLPVAIDKLFQAGQADESTRIAAAWVDRAPDNPLALACLVRSHLRQQNPNEALRTIRRFRDEFEADTVWPENIVASALISITSDEMEPKWMAAGPICQALRSGTLDYERVTSLLEFLVPAVDSNQRALLFAGLLALNAGDNEDARALFQTTAARSPGETYIRNVGLARAIRDGDDPERQLEALKETWQALGDPQVANLAEAGELFDPPATRVSVGLMLARMLQALDAHRDALQYLNALLRSGSDDPDVVRLHAEILGKSGSKTEALAGLERLLATQEAAHHYAAAIETLQSMIRLAPGKMRFRSQLVDHSLQIGQFDRAIEQLVMQGRLLHRADRLTDAEMPVHRAIEIATMIGDWDKVDKLHRLLIGFDPNETRPRHAAVTTYVQHGRTREALDQLREIVRLARKKNDPDEAIAASHQMLALDANDPDTYHQLGELLISIQEYGQADRVYRRLETLAPDDPVVKAKRSAIAAINRSRHHSG